MAALLRNLTQNLTRDTTQINEVLSTFWEFPERKFSMHKAILAVKIQTGRPRLWLTDGKVKLDLNTLSELSHKRS